MTNFIEITVDTNELYSELVGDILAEFGCKGIVLSERYFNDELAHKNSPGVRGYIAEQLLNENKRLELQNILDTRKENLKIDTTASGSWNATYKLIKEEDWAESWKQYWHPERIGENIIICPSWEDYKDLKDEDILITLDPGSAFGTGSHQTTRLCIRALEKLLKGEHSYNRIIDIGTGSGILAIVAAKMRVKNISGIDIDPVSIDVAIENSEENNVSQFCHFSTTPIRSIQKEYDLVIVNILAKTIIAMSEDIKKVTKDGGTLLISGLIKPAVEKITNRFTELGYEIIEITSEDEWYAVLAKK